MPVESSTEQNARVRIDALLEAAGWVVQDMSAINLGAATGIAVREFPVGKESLDYLLYVDGKAIGIIEAKREGTTLLGVEQQLDRYTTNFSNTASYKQLPHWQLPLPFGYLSTGVEQLSSALKEFETLTESLRVRKLAVEKSQS